MRARNSYAWITGTNEDWLASWIFGHPRNRYIDIETHREIKGCVTRPKSKSGGNLRSF